MFAGVLVLQGAIIVFVVADGLCKAGVVVFHVRVERHGVPPKIRIVALLALLPENVAILKVQRGDEALHWLKLLKLLKLLN